MPFSHLRYLLALLLLTPQLVHAVLIINAPQDITHTVRVQPIIVSDNNGQNTATFFGNALERSQIEQFVDNIWAQAGIDVEFLPAQPWNNTFANWGMGGPPNNGGATRPTNDILTIRSDAFSANVTHPDSEVINIFFVRIPAGFSLLSGNSAAGLAFIGANGITQYVGVNLLTFTGGQEVIASVVAHEIGHNLGLPHPGNTPEFTQNLMSVSGAPNPGERLNNDQINVALNSAFSVENPVTQVPIPSIYLMLLALVLLKLGHVNRAVIQ